MTVLLDTHYHFDFLPAGEARRRFLAGVADAGVQVVAQTLTPSGFMALLGEADALGGVPLPRWSVGFHPWHITSDEQADAELAVFVDAVRQTRFIGEIGLDFSPRRLADAPAASQVRVLRDLLEQVCQAASDAPAGEPYLLSIHAVRSASEVIGVLRELEVTSRNVVPVFHWFSGTSDELTEAIRLGGYLSVNPQMLAGKRGRAYVRQVPADRLLLESDLPAEAVEAGSDAAADAADALVANLHRTLAALSELRQCDLAAEIAQTQERLYGVR